MTNINYKGLFQGWEVAVAKNLINEFKKKWQCLDIDEFEDLLQECLIHWLLVKDRYAPEAEASEKTFMGLVVRNKLNDIVKNHDRLCRRDFYDTVSLDEPLFDDKGDSPTLLDKFKDDAEVAALRIRAELKIDISKAYKQLTSNQKKLCELLGQQGLSVSQASEILKIPRTTVCDEVKRIKAIFMGKMLHEYLK